MSKSDKTDDRPEAGRPRDDDLEVDRPNGDRRGFDLADAGPSQDDQAQDDQPQDDQQSLRGSVELPRVVLGDDEAARRAPRKRVLPGLVDLRWLSYPAYVTCFFGGGIAVNVAIDTQEWAAPPIAIAWMALFFWEWIYGVAYRYRRRVLKYFSFLLVIGLSLMLAIFCWDRAEPQLAATTQGLLTGGLAQRGHIESLDWAAIFALISGALIALHVVILGRGYRKTRGYREEDHRDTKNAPRLGPHRPESEGEFPQSRTVDRQ